MNRSSLSFVLVYGLYALLCASTYEKSFRLSNTTSYYGPKGRCMRCFGELATHRSYGALCDDLLLTGRRLLGVF